MRAAVRFFLASPLLLLCIGAVGFATAQAASEPVAPDEIPAVDCTQFPRAADGTRRQTFDAFDPSAGIAAMPPRIVTELAPGESDSYCVGFQNRGADPIDLHLDVVDVGADDEGLPTSQRDAEDRGASRWVTIPTTRIRNLPSGDVAWLEVDVDVPGGALPGSSYAAILATDAQRPTPSGASAVDAIPSIAAQLFFDIPGDASREGTVTKIDSPRVIWWDGLDLGNVPVLDDLRGLGVAPIRFTFRNTGDFTSDVGGAVVIRSDLAGRQVASLPVTNAVVLRGAERRFSVTWSRDIPLVGRFTPVLEVRTEAGDVDRYELKPIWVIPAWWYLALLMLAIGLPLWWRRRSRRRYEELLARVEAAESRASHDEEWADGDEWDGGR